MVTPAIPPEDEGSTSANALDSSRSRGDSWSPMVSKLKVSEVPTGATSLNVDGRQVTGPLQGFGQLWQKTFRISLNGVDVTPQEVIRVWKANFPKFHAKENRFYATSAGIEPGEIVLINAMTPGGPVDTGMLVLYVDEESFTLMTPEGHPESGWVTFSAYEEAGVTIAQVQTLARANDPIYELAFLFAGTKLQDSIWTSVLTSLAKHFNSNATVEVQKVCVDPKRQWSRARNVWQNAQIRTMVYTLGAPIRWITGGSKKSKAAD